MNKFTFFLAILLLSGCADPVTTITNSKPVTYDIPKSKTVLFNQSKETTWDSLLSAFSTSKYRIERINMHAHQVYMQLKDQPDLYLDCGIKKIATEGEVKTITNTRADYSYTAHRNNHVDNFTISNNFTGRVNLLVTGNDTTSKVTAQFDLELQTHEKMTTTQGWKYYTDRDYTLIVNPYDTVFSKAFNSYCHSTGKFERRVLELVSSLVPVPADNDSGNW